MNTAAAPSPLTSQQEAAERFERGLRLSPVLARLLAIRGWRELAAVTEFLYPRLEHTHSPWLMRGMEAAVDRILAAVAAGESIRIQGDYDADGVLAVVILRRTLLTLGAHVDYAIPHRLEEGYGVSVAAVESAAAEGIRLLITVDTGIREFEAMRRARELELDAVITDHHLPGPELPPAVAVLNPHQPGCTYPDKYLCGSAIAFKLAHALLERSGRISGTWPPALQAYLKLVALGTIADSVPLLGENRVLTRFGLQGLSQPVNPGLRALLDLARAPGATLSLTAEDVGFRVAPRLNAAGRMGAAGQAVELFFSDEARAIELAQTLDVFNRVRQVTCDEILRQLDARCAAAPASLEGPVLIFAGVGWHRGVLGIVASRMLQRTGKPVLVAGMHEESAEGNGNGLLAHGSGRAPIGIHLLELLDSCSHLLGRYGGHAQAVGFSVAVENLEPLRQALNRAAAASAGLAPAPVALPAVMDLTLEEITPGLARDLERMAPFGEGNAEPEFRLRGVRLAGAPRILKERHLKLLVEQSGSQGNKQMEALLWNRTPELAPGALLDLVGRVRATTHPEFGQRIQFVLSSIATA